jgi:hypothetical protein
MTSIPAAELMIATRDAHPNYHHVAAASLGIIALAGSR